MSTVQRVVKNSGFLYAKMMVTIFVSLYTTRLVLDSLGASDFGIFFVVGSAIGMLGFVNASMASATQRFMSYYKGREDPLLQKQIFNVSLIVHFLIAILFGLILLLAGYFLFDTVLNIPENRMDAAKTVYAALIISTVFSVMTVPYDALLNAHENMLFYSIVGIVESLLKLLVAFFILNYTGDKLKLYGILMSCVPILILLLMRVYCHKCYKECVIAPKRYWNKDLLQRMSSFGGWSFLGVSAAMIVNYGQSLILNSFFGTTINTSQGIANQLSGQLNAVTLNMMKALNPIIAKREGAGDRLGMIKATILGCKVSTLIMLFVFVPIWIEIPFLLKFWLTEVPIYAEIFCRLILINTLIGYTVLPVATSLAAHGDIKRYEIVNALFYYVPLLIMLILFTKGFPAYFSYLIMGTHTFLAGAVTLYFAYKNYQFTVGQFFNTVILRCSFVLLLMLIISSLPTVYMQEGLIRFIGVGVLSSITFIFSVWFVGFNLDDKAMFLQFFAGALKRIKLITLKK